MTHGLLQAQRRVWLAAELQPLEKLTVLAILDHWSRRQQQPFPSVRRLENLTGMGRSTVLRAIAELERKGWMIVNRRQGAKSTYDLGPLFTRASSNAPTGIAPIPVDERETGTGEELVISDAADANASEPVSLGHRTGIAPTPEPVSQRDPKGATKEPKKEPRGSARAKRKAWRRVPSDWQPNEEHRNIASKEGRDFDTELARFRDHEFQRAYVDADACFRNWLRNAFGGAPRNYVPQRNGSIRSAGHFGGAE